MKKKKHMDEHFKEKFDQMEFDPSNNNWSKIASDLEAQDIDQLVKKGLESIEPTPSPHIWNAVKNRLPLSLWVRNQLNWLSKIAAVLVLFMVVTLVWNKNKPTETAVLIIDEKIGEVPALLVEAPQEPTDFVFPLENDSPKNIISASEELSLDDEITREELLTDLFDEEEDFLADVENDVIEKSLEMHEALTSETLQADLPQLIFEGGNAEILED